MLSSLFIPDFPEAHLVIAKEGTSSRSEWGEAISDDQWEPIGAEREREEARLLPRDHWDIRWGVDAVV